MNESERVVAPEERGVPIQRAESDARVSLQKLLNDAVKNRASDLHLENRSRGLVARIRVDGVLQPKVTFHRDDAARIITACKVWAEMDIGERRVPQDGRIEADIGGHRFDLRISSAPVRMGEADSLENIVIRILDKENAPTVESLGLDQALSSQLLEIAEQPNGMLICTGPTGSGKTTTQYALLRYRNTDEVKILTAEDPVEYQLDGISQVQINEAAGLTFQTALRSFLRQDPDIIMVGEMRDKETAEMAMEAALTGHLVLSTLHANDSASTVTRLSDMGIEPYLISATITGVMAQRLARRICPHCKEAYVATEKEMGILRRSPRLQDASTITLYKGRGCDACNKTGYLGRLGIYELLAYNEEIGNLVSHRATASEIRQRAIECGTKTLLEYGVDKILAGITTPSEIERVVFTANIG